MLILVFLVLNRSSDTAKVISSLSKAVTNDTLVLQGRGSGTLVADNNDGSSTSGITGLLSAFPIRAQY